MSLFQELKRRNVFKVAAFPPCWIPGKSTLRPIWQHLGDPKLSDLYLEHAIRLGWKFDWPWHWANKNLDPIRNDPLFAELETRMNEETAEQLATIKALPADKQVRLNPQLTAVIPKQAFRDWPGLRTMARCPP